MDIQRDVQEYMRRKKAALYALLLNWAGVLANYAKQNAPWDDRTGHTRQGIHSGVDKDGDRFVMYLSHGQATGKYLEEGTGLYGPYQKPYVIKPKNKKALYWDGLPHPVKKVTVQGIKPRPIIKPTVDLHIGRIRDTVRQFWRG